MKRIILFSLVLSALVLGSATIARADSTQAVVKADYYGATDTVKVPQTVTGDVFAAGSLIDSTGIVGGDILAAGSKITISGQVAGNLRLAGGQISIGGDIGRNITVAGGQVDILPTAHIHGNVLVLGGNVTVAGPVDGTLQVMGGNLILQNSVGGDVRVKASQVTLASTASIAGNFDYTSDHIAEINGGSKIQGSTTRHAATTANSSGVLRAGYSLWLLITELIMGTVVIFLLPKAASTTAVIMRQQPWTAFGVGILTLLILPLVIAIIATTIIGIPLALLLGLLLLVGLMIAHIIAAIWAGGIMAGAAKWELSLIKEFMLGATFIWAISLLPGLGGAALLALTFTGLGSIIMALKQTRQA